MMIKQLGCPIGAKQNELIIENGEITCVVSCELYNNMIGVYLKKNVYVQGVKRKV